MQCICWRWLWYHDCRDLVVRGERKSSDPIATVYYNKEEFSTHVIQKTRFPRWKKSFDLNVPKHFSDHDSESLVIVVYDFDRLAHNKFMGQVCGGVGQGVGKWVGQGEGQGFGWDWTLLRLRPWASIKPNSVTKFNCVEKKTHNQRM